VGLLHTFPIESLMYIRSGFLDDAIIDAHIIPINPLIIIDIASEVIVEHPYNIFQHISIITNNGNNIIVGKFANNAFDKLVLLLELFLPELIKLPLGIDRFIINVNK